ncbi:MAG TPA: 3-phosphoshikimate 1-carboxyvinyltransferase, partial [Ignavibacteriaceae bacterium]
MIQSFKKVNKVSGELSLPGDKSISHRALIISALAEGESAIKNLPTSDDVQSTISCLENLGVEIHRWDKYTAVGGLGFKGFKKPGVELNAGNSGTTARLLSGVLAVQDFDTTLIGDASLANRPMKRIIEPLRMMGAEIMSSDSQTLPLTFSPASKINSIDYTLPVSSAQVKGAILFAGLHCDEKTKIRENEVTRDHTERILALKTEITGGKINISVSKKDFPTPKEFFIPGDLST